MAKNDITELIFSTNVYTFAILFFTDKVYTVFLTITNQIFTDRLKDIESLEFLNLAEKLQVAVRNLNYFKQRFPLVRAV